MHYVHLVRLFSKWTLEVLRLCRFLNSLDWAKWGICSRYAILNCVLINWYQNREDSMGLHDDKYWAMGPDPFIVSVSFEES